MPLKTKSTTLSVSSRYFSVRFSRCVPCPNPDRAVIPPGGPTACIAPLIMYRKRDAQQRHGSRDHSGEGRWAHVHANLRVICNAFSHVIGHPTFNERWPTSFPGSKGFHGQRERPPFTATTERVQRHIIDLWSVFWPNVFWLTNIIDWSYPQCLTLVQRLQFIRDR